MAAAPTLPLIDVALLGKGSADEDTRIATELGRACRENGFFRIRGHGVPDELLEQLLEASRQFFAQPLHTKTLIGMSRGGRAWRGYFPVGGELTSGQPDRKEGIYFGAELSTDSPEVKAGTPMHGPNLFPAEPAQMRGLVLRMLSEMTRLGHRVMSALALSLGLPADAFARDAMRDPLVLFRIFNYPPAESEGDSQGVGEHTDYGVLTLLAQDGTSGLEVKSQGGWIEVPAEPGVLVCNIGDMLERLTGGLFRSTPHRVINRTARSRLSMPFFFDPGFHWRIAPLPLPGADGAIGVDRWDGLDLHAVEGTYGDYLVQKVSRVFPQLKQRVL